MVKYTFFSLFKAILIIVFLFSIVPSYSQENSEFPEVNRELENFARQFSFEYRRVSFPQHTVLGSQLRPDQLFSSEKEIYQELTARTFWNDFDFTNFALEPLPTAPFRSVIVGKISSLGEQRYEVFLELRGFEDRYALGVILAYIDGVLTIIIVRYL